MIFFISLYNFAKEMYDVLQIIHEVKTEEKRDGMNTLTDEFELFRMKPEKIFQDMENGLFTLLII